MVCPVKMKIHKIDGEFDNYLHLPRESLEIKNIHQRRHIVKCFDAPSIEISRNLWIWNFIINNGRCSLFYDSHNSDTKEVGLLELQWAKGEFTENEILAAARMIEKIIGVDIDLQEAYKDKPIARTDTKWELGLDISESL